MKLAKVMIAGIIIWAASLIWPQINQWLTHSAMLWSALGLASLTAGYGVVYLHRQLKNGANSSPPPKVQPDRADTRPFKPVGIA